MDFVDMPPACATGPSYLGTRKGWGQAMASIKVVVGRRLAHSLAHSLTWTCQGFWDMVSVG